MNNNKRPPGGRSRAALYVLAAALTMAAIFWFSTDAFSSDATRRWLGEINETVRKAAHVTEYAVLFLVLRFASARLFRKRGNLVHVPLALTLAILYASLDEWHQTFVPSRSGSGSDVLLDAAGATVGLALWLAWCGLARLRQSSSTTQR